MADLGRAAYALAQSKWAGKKWAVVGDSITYGQATTKTYWQYIADQIGCACINYGISGTGWRSPSSYGSNNAIYQRIGGIDTSCDLVTIFAGTNDWGEQGIGMTLGAVGDSSGSTSLYGSIDNTLLNLQAMMPWATIAVFTPIQRASAWYNKAYTISNSWAASISYVVGTFVTPTVANGHAYVCTTAGTSGSTEPAWTTTSGATQPTDGTVVWKEYATNPSGVSLQDVSNAIVTVANKYNVPVLDLYKNGNAYVQNNTYKSNYMPDGTHPNEAGHKHLADKILAFLNTL